MTAAAGIGLDRFVGVQVHLLLRFNHRIAPCPGSARFLLSCCHRALGDGGDNPVLSPGPVANKSHTGR